MTMERAAIVSVGDELVLGQVLDTNAKWLAGRLMDLGIAPVRFVTLADDLEAHAEALVSLAGVADVILCTGGLGPTADDLTRGALARAMGEELVEDPVALSQVEAWYAARGRPMPAINRVQALRPKSGQSLPNLHGTAPGLWGVVRGRGMSGGADGRRVEVFCMPGVPSEMFPMFEASVAPRLRPPTGRTVRTRVLHCFGIGESDLATRLGALMDRTRNPLVGTTASGGVVSCRIRYEGPEPPMLAERLLDETERAVRAAAKPYVFGSGTQTLPEVVVGLLASRGQTVGTVESCTGGLIAGALTSVAGSSAVVRGGLVTYANEAKASLAGVPKALMEPGGPGAVSREVAEALARGGLERLGVDHCVSVTGVAGPTGGSEAKPVGTVWIGRASRDGSVDVRLFRMTGDRASVRDWSVRSALAMLWQHLSGAGAGADPVPLLREVRP